ncbi:transposase [Bradyrhizobium sp. CB1650]|uniref:IS66 family transposase n=1 Tax=Bradyrhizobium sp. CB1650 TaxID=3039153 RepID=UPI002434CFD3|nr:transposase [Bradyrhizobium sp. CB1650]WGD56573.1 transposase [Bradyrhizobium sp. CB1650]
MRAGAYAGLSKLYEVNRKAGPIIEAACRAHGRRKFFDLARLSKAPIAAEAVRRIDVLFAIEREINGLAPQDRLRVRHERSRPLLIVELDAWLRERRTKLSKNNDTTKAINYRRSRWNAFTRFLDGLCFSNNAAERELRAVALGRRNSTFAGSDEGGRRAAASYTLIASGKLNDIDSQAWLADVLGRCRTTPQSAFSCLGIDALRTSLTRRKHSSPIQLTTRSGEFMRASRAARNVRTQIYEVVEGY